jgi:cystathionine gamma-synthase
MAFAQIPLGTPIPDRPHAVSCSLPTMADVEGYEQKDPAVHDHLQTGYPRFVVHPFARRLAAVLAQRHRLGERTLWLASSPRMAAALLEHLGAPAAPFAGDGIFGVSHPADPPTATRAKLYLQHVGGFLPSREAEDALARLGAGPAAAAEPRFAGDSGAEVARQLLPLFPRADRTDLFLANSGMNAIHAAFRAVSRVQAPRGRTAWLQLGWVYLDTIAILRKFTPRAEDYLFLAHVRDTAALRALFDAHGRRLAGVIAEVPTNPLVDTPDVAALAALCRAHGVKLLLDPSISSAFSVDVLAHADLLTTSLTKYTASDGDVMAGAAVVNPAGPDAAALRAALADHIEPPYARDLARLAAQIGATPAVLEKIEAGTAQVAAFLAAHPAVGAVYWAQAPGSAANYAAIARRPGATGGMISFTLKGPLARFYDRLRLPKGPSFGMRSTLICPFMYLAHYDLVSTPAGRAELARHGLEADLLRLCVGTEPAAEITAALGEALAD